MVWIFLVVGVLAFGMTIALGYLALRATAVLSEDECWALSGAVGAALLAAIAFTAFLTGLFHPSFYLAAWLACLVATIVAVRRFTTTLEHGIAA